LRRTATSFSHFSIMMVSLGTIIMRSMLLKHSLHSARALEEQAQKKALASTLPFSASVRPANIRGFVSTL
jgi:hypothetical protein